MAAPTLCTATEGSGMSILLQVRDITKRFGGLQALSRVSFDLAQGEILGLIGPNGAGKTTLFNTINGVYRPDEGRVMFRGQDITGKKPYHLSARAPEPEAEF